MRKIFTLTRNAREISGNDVQKMWPSKNDLLTAGQPADCVIASPTRTMKTTVLATAMRTLRSPAALHALEDLRLAAFRGARVGEHRLAAT